MKAMKVGAGWVVVGQVQGTPLPPLPAVQRGPFRASSSPVNRNLAAQQWVQASPLRQTRSISVLKPAVPRTFTRSKSNRAHFSCAWDQRTRAIVEPGSLLLSPCPSSSAGAPPGAMSTLNQTSSLPGPVQPSTKPAGSLSLGPGKNAQARQSFAPSCFVALSACSLPISVVPSTALNA